MSKSTNDDLTQSGTGCFIAVRYPYDNVKGLKIFVRDLSAILSQYTARLQQVYNRGRQ